jgi:hypothetical protein
MGLRLRHVPPMQGSQWLRQAWRHFLRQPLRFSLLFLTYLLVASVIGAVPLVGSVLSLATMPLLSLAFMLATQDVIQGRPVSVRHLFAVARQPKKQRRTTLLLCLAFGVAVVVIIEIGVYLGGSELTEALKPLAEAKGGGDAKLLMSVFAHPAVSRLANTIWFLAALLSVPFWHALALVHWGGQTAAQALFSSTLALWRAKGAFLVYGLGWLGMVVLASLLAGIGAGLLTAAAGSPTLAMAFVALIFIAISAAFYISLWFMFQDSFVLTDEAPGPGVNEGPLPS